MKFFEKGELKILWPFYLESFFAYVIQFAPAFSIIYFLSLGMSLTKIGFLLAVIPLSSLIFEIPTGAIADIYGRKFSVLLGYFLEGIAMFLIFFTQNYSTLVIIFIFWGAVATFSSGSWEAWIVDLVKKKNKKLVQTFFSKSKFIQSIALILSGIIGALFVKMFGLSLIWIVSGFSFFIGIILLLPAQEIKEKRKVNGNNGHLKNLYIQSKKSISYSIKHPVLLYLLIADFFMIISVAFAESLAYVPFLSNLGMPNYAFGYFWSATWLVMAIAPLCSKKFLGKHKEVNFLFVVTLIGSLILLLVYFAYSYLSAILIIIISLFFFGLKYPIERPYFHKFVPNKLRATVGSFKSMICSFAGIIALPIGGFLIDLIGARLLIIISALLGIPTLIAYLFIKENKSL
ncbi:MAG: MFS transporter [Candidatus Pacearchaeota archaeon]